MTDVFDLEAYLKQLSEAAEITDCPKVPLPPIDKNQNYLFISYSHRDYKEVYSDLAHLYTSGVRFWYDKGLTVGRDWEIEVEEHIHDPRCCGIVFYVSTNMFLSDSILKEIKFTQTWKNGVLIRQKNFFCVNLHSGNISDILFDAQAIQKANNEKRIDTEVIHTLTSTFSDKDTHIVYNDKYHLEEMVGQIRRQFNVIDGEISTPEPSVFDSATTPKEAVRTFFIGKISLIRLCRHLYSEYKANKKSRAWYMIPIAWLIGLVTVFGMTTLLAEATDLPIIKYLIDNYSQAYVFVTTLVFGILLLPYEILKLFWLFCLTPIYGKCERNPNLKPLNSLIFLYSSIIAAAVIPMLCVVILVVFTAVFTTIKPLI